jgi:hypothetical protein
VQRMNLPGFAAEASLYETHQHYATTSFGTSGGVIPQVAPAMSGTDLYYCRLACAYCRYLNYACFECYVCAVIIATGGFARL